MMRKIKIMIGWLTRFREVTLGLTIVVLFAIIALFSPLLAPESWILPNQAEYKYPDGFRMVGTELNPMPQPPGGETILGTSGKKVDVYFSLVRGTRSAFAFGVPVALGAALIGCLVGAIGGLYGGRTSWLLMRITDGFLSFPIIAGVVMVNELRRTVFFYTNDFWDYYSTPVFAMKLASPVLQAFLSLQAVFILLTWMPYARIVNSMVLRLRASEFVMAAEMVGASRWRIITRHMIPNVIAPVIVMVSRDIGAVVLLHAALTFTHFTGGSIWGELLSYGRDFIMGTGGNPLRYWWVFIPPSLVIILFGVGWSLLGDGINTWLNPRTRQKFRL